MYLRKCHNYVVNIEIKRRGTERNKRGRLLKNILTTFNVTLQLKYDTCSWSKEHVLFNDYVFKQSGRTKDVQGDAYWQNDLLDSKDWLKNTSHRQAFICANSITITLLKRLRKDRHISAQKP